MNPPLPSRTASVSQAAALGFAAAVMLVPANILPVLSTNTGGLARTDTIFSGIVGLWKDGMWAISAIVFIASIMIPALKLLGLAWLLIAASRRTKRSRRALTRTYAIIEFIGRWSMLDVFLAGFLSGVVQFGALANVEPRAGIVAFAAAVVLTVLATDAFDPRLLWDDRRSDARDAAPATSTRSA
jgi:paraquat-inducible protein A